MKINKGSLLILLLSAIAGLISGTALRNLNTVYTFTGKDAYTVIVDAGHGSPDGGAVGVSGTLEKDINLDIALKLAEVLEAKGIHAILTRTGDMALFSDEDETLRQKKRSDMKNRLNIMKNSNADMFISIHMNSFEDSSAKGLNIFYAQNYPELADLCELMQTRISNITGAKVNTVKAADASLFLMKNPPVPAILAECGFISNAEEEKKLNDENYRSRIAWALAESLELYFSTEKAQKTAG